jgi:signal transduction histidine kinase
VPIIGYVELGMLGLLSDSKLDDDLMQVKVAAERAANLTRQILAFSRQQVLEMRAVDLNQVIVEFTGMVQHLIGEDVELQTSLAPDLAQIRANRAQIEQILMNLVVNARDAMPGGAKLTIETQLPRSDHP